MGTYVNPGNAGFVRVLAGRYVDKTGIIGLVNATLNTPRGMVCVTRPRRFGKSYAAESLVAYYSCGCDSRGLFAGLDISQNPSFEEHLNAYNLIRLDLTEFTGTVGADVVPEVLGVLMDELVGMFDFVESGMRITEALLRIVRETGRKFVFVIDEWDAPFRDAVRDEEAQRRYVNLLRLLFKTSTFTPEAVAGAYITGILPIKRYGTQSALTDFDEFTMVDCAAYAPYVGFTESEVEELCAAYHMDLSEMRRWYDGYEFPEESHVYAPFSVMKACERHRVGSYWTGSDAFSMLRGYIDMDFDGLQGDIMLAIGGEELQVDPETFQNDMREIHSEDDALTLLVHLGYLAYNWQTGRARVPNEEVRAEFRRAMAGSSHKEVARIIRESDQLLHDVLSMDEDAVAAGFARAHDAGCGPRWYNDEQALRAVVKAALISAADEYARVEELPSGHGFADVVYLPKHGNSKPALLVELKWDKPVVSAIEQIRQKDYPAVLRDLDVPVLIVGVTYDAATKEHSCVIERIG